MRFKPRNRRLVWGLGTLLVLGLMIALLPRIVLASDGARTELVERIEDLTGAPVTVTGPIEYSIFPRTRLSANGIEIGAGHGISIERIVADFDPVDALLGRAKIARMVLVRPQHQPPKSASLLEITAEANRAASSDPLVLKPVSSPRRSASLIIADLEDLARNAIERMDQLQILVIRNGVWRTDGNSFGPNGISNANLTVTRTSSRSAFRLAGNFVWKGQPTDIDMRVASTTALQAGGESGVSLEMTSPVLDIDFDGTMLFGSSPRLQGRLEGRGEAFERTALWLSGADYDVPRLGAIALSGDLSLAGQTLAIRDAELEIAGSSGRGALEFDLDRDRVDGTLAFTTLDLTPISEAIVPMPRGPFGLVRPIEAEFARSAELDLRISASEARFGSLGFTDVAAVLHVGDGDVSLELGDAALYGGRAFGRLALHDDGRTRITGVLNGSGIDLTQMSDAIGGSPIGLSGTGQFQAELTTKADDWRTILADAKSDFTLTAQNGSLTGFDPSVFGQPGVQPIYRGMTGGALPFEQLTTHLTMIGPDLSIEGLSMRNSGYRLEMAGTARLGDGGVDLSGTSEALPQTASTAGGEREFIRAKPIPFTVRGTWPDLRVVTDRVTRSTDDNAEVQPSDL